MHSQLLAQMMGNYHSTTKTAHDVLDGTELSGRHIKVNEEAEATFPSDVFEAAPTDRSVAEKRKGAIPAVESGNFN